MKNVGTLLIYDKYETSGGTVAINRISPGVQHFTIRLGASIILDTDEWYYVGVRKTIPKMPPYRIFILDLGTGGTACGGYSQVLEIVSEKKWTLTKEFGNCNYPRIDVRNKRVEFYFPPSTGDPGVSSERWRYEDGKLTQMKK